MTLLRNRCHLDNAVGWLEANGVPTETMLRDSGLTGPDSRGYIPLVPMLDFFERVAAELQDPTFGLKLGLQTDPYKAGLLGYLAATSPSLRAALENLAEFFPLHQSCSGVTLIDEGGTTRIVYETREPEIEAYQQDIDFALGFGANMIRFLTGKSNHSEIALTCEKFSHRNSYEDRCGSPVSFRKSEASIIVPTSVMDAPLRQHDPGLFKTLMDFARVRIARSEPDDFIASIRNQVIKSLQADGMVPSIKQVAQNLHMATRSLQRKIRQRGTNFRNLVDETRHQLAIEYLRSRDANLSQVAIALGFSELSAFDRAFSRWTGSNPRTFRRKNFGID